jgi:hypothetical protein
MRSKIFFSVFFVLSVLSGFSSTWAAKYSGEFLSLGVGGKALAMGGAFVSLADDGFASYWNPAGLVQLSQKELTLMHAETFGSLVNHDFIGYVIPLKKKEKKSALALSLLGLSGGGIKITELENPKEPLGPANRPRVKKEESHGDYVLFFSYAQEVKKKFSLGGNVKIIYRHLALNSAFGFGLDWGILARIHKNFSFGLNLMDAFTTTLFYDTGTKESIYPTLKVGFNFHKETGDFKIVLSSDADLRIEGRKYASQLWVEEKSLDTHFGGELSYQNRLFGRMGIDQGNFTAGAGLLIKKFMVDFAFLNHKDLDNSYQFSLGVRF